MKEVSTHVHCPSCDVRMVTRVMACPDCGLRMETNFKENEFARLEGEWLHFLRIFVHCEGKIRDMEAALGVSYPTIKARVAELKSRLGISRDEIVSEGAHEHHVPVDETLRALEAGEIDYDEAMRRIRGE